MKVKLILVILLAVSACVMLVSFSAHALQTTQTTFTGPTYTVPSGVKITVYGSQPATSTQCNNWPDKPSVLPCYVKIDAVATDSAGFTKTASQWWYYCATLPSGKCKK